MSFTWHRNKHGLRILSKKLDRGLANIQWRLAFQKAFVEVLCRLHSEHNPIILRFGGLPIVCGPRPFRFEAAWINHNDYMGVAEHAWMTSNNNPVAALRLVQENSITFNHNVFGKRSKLKLDLKVSNVTLRELIHVSMLSWKTIFKGSTTISSFKRRFIGIKNRVNNGLSLVTRIVLSFIPKQLSGTKEIRLSKLGFRMVFGPVIVPLSNMKHKTTSKTFYVALQITKEPISRQPLTPVWTLTVSLPLPSLLPRKKFL